VEDYCSFLEHLTFLGDIMLDTIIVMRHVKCEIKTEERGLVDGTLDRDGEAQANRVAHVIDKLVNGRRVQLLTSSASRCTQTALLINGILRYPYEESVSLGSNTMTFRMFLNELLKRKDVATPDVYLLVTHEVFVGETIRMMDLRADRTSHPKGDPFGEFPYGCLLVVNCRERTAKLMIDG
jgi:phosphohistidine phosphatase SixA